MCKGHQLNNIGDLVKKHKAVETMNSFIVSWKKVMFSSRYRKYFRDYRT